MYGSIEKHCDDLNSDIDLMLVGMDLHYAEVMELLLPLEQTLQRTLNPTLYTQGDFEKKRASGNNFLKRVMEQPKLMIKGLINDTGEPGKNKGASR